jgi:DNA-directed RNA polymerase specialized sigma24 family protein
MMRVARWYRPDEDGARRLVRQAWVTALGGLDMFTWHTSFRAWLFGILLNHCHGTPADARSTKVAAADPQTPPGGCASAATRWRVAGPAMVSGLVAGVVGCGG